MLPSLDKKTGKRIIHIMIGLWFLIGEIFSQQMPVYSQYFINGFVINPAMAGSDGTVKIQLTARDYAIGLVDGPKTFTASVNGRLLRQSAGVRNGRSTSRSGNVGMGGLIYSDYNGLVKRMGLHYTYAYHIDLSGSQLSFGLSASLAQTRIDANKLIFNEYEPLLKDGYKNVTYVPDASLGVLYKMQDYYAGLTVSNMFQRSVNFGAFDYHYVMYRHYYLHGGTNFDLGQDIYLATSFLLKATSNNLFQAEFSTRFSFLDNFWLATTYRTPQIAALMIGVRAEKVFVAYAYEYNFGAIRSFSFGAHELCIVYRIGDTERRYPWMIRY